MLNISRCYIVFKCDKVEIGKPTLLDQDLNFHRPQADADHPRRARGESTVNLVNLQAGSTFYRSRNCGAGVIEDPKLITIIVDTPIDQHLTLERLLRVGVRDNQYFNIV